MCELVYVPMKPVSMSRTGLVSEACSLVGLSVSPFRGHSALMH